MSASVTRRNEERRSTNRSSLFLAATLYVDGLPTPVRIRNLSSAGALIETPTIPNVGELVELVRGRLTVHGLISWHQGAKCGLKFSGLIDVLEWRASPSNSEQARVDELVRLAKAGALPAEPSVRPPEKVATSIADDLLKSAKLLEKLGDVLAADLDILSRYGGVLQNLDIAAQMIAAVQMIIDQGGNSASDSSHLDGLRKSADQALKTE